MLQLCFQQLSSGAFSLPKALPLLLSYQPVYLTQAFPEGHNGIPMAGISCSSAFEVVGKSSSQHLVTGSFIAHVAAAALKFPKDIFSRTLSVPKIRRNQRNWGSLCRNFPDPSLPPKLLFLLPWTLGGTWKSLEISLKVSDDFDMWFLLQHKKNFVPCVVANL